MKHILGTSALAAVILISAGTAKAAGYQLNEYSATGMGRAFAGSGVVGDDFSAIGFNPAGMSLNKTNGLQTGASMVSIHADYKGDNGYGIYDDGHTRITRVLPNGFAQYKLTDRATVGLGIYVPFGLATDYDNNWFAESHGGLSQITNINVSPAISYQIHDMVSVGAALNFQHAKARITSANRGVNQNLKGDDWALGYTLGLTVQPIETVRLGVSYRSKVSHHLQGKIKMSGYPSALGFDGNYDISAKIETPETVLFSGAYDMTDRLTLSASARWTRWSRFKNLDIIAEESFKTVAGMRPVTLPAGTAISSTYENWKNTWFYALGADYKLNKSWTVRLGAAYDETVIKSPEYRTVRIPDGRRVWTSLGFSYAYNNIQIDAGYTHIFIHGGRAEGGDTSQPKTPNIKYSSDANMFSLGLQYKF